MVTIGSLLLSIALLILVGLFVLRPLLLTPREENSTLTPRQMLLAQKEALVEQIRSLDFDYETGMVPAEEYERERARLAAETAETLRLLDGMAPSVGDAVMDDIEAAIDRRRQKSSQPQVDSTPVLDDIEMAVARRRGQAAAAVQRPMVAATEATLSNRRNGRAYCPQCGEAHDHGDKFCAYCGHHLA